MTDHSCVLQRVQHHAQDAVDAEPGMPEAGVGHARRITRRSCAPQVLSRFVLGSPGFWMEAWTIFPPCVAQGGR